MNISNIIYKQDIMHHIPGHLLWHGCIISAFFLHLLTSLVLSGEPGDRCKDFGSIRLRHTIAHHTNPQLILLTSHPDLYIINERKTKYYPQKLFHSKTVYSQKIKVWTLSKTKNKNYFIFKKLLKEFMWPLSKCEMEKWTF